MSNQLDQKQMLAVATLGKSVGLRGYMKLHLQSDFPQQFQNGKTFFINGDHTVTIEHIKDSLVKFVGIDTPEDAKRLTNKQLYTTHEETRENCELKENEYFYFDLIGSAVIENSKHLGIIKDIDRLGSVDYLMVETDTDLVQDKLPKSFLIPYQPPFIVDVDIKAHVVQVNGGLDILKAS